LLQFELWGFALFLSPNLSDSFLLHVPSSPSSSRSFVGMIYHWLNLKLRFRRVSNVNQPSDSNIPTSLLLLVDHSMQLFIAWRRSFFSIIHFPSFLMFFHFPQNFRLMA
jgi:hypothetical protein